MEIIKPILKWAGGKRQLLETIKGLMPIHYNRYIEPFCGGAALYFDLQPNNAILNDKNQDLINCYIQIRDRLPYVKRELNQLTRNHSEEFYYQMRALFNSRRKRGNLNSVDAALMIYLNKAGFNGMFRENLKGDFNIPSGKKDTVKLYENENITLCSTQLTRAELYSYDFEVVAEQALPRDFVFFDSPYDATFHNYQASGFPKEDHIRLAELFHRLSERGVYCLLTNSSTPFIKSLYEDYPYTMQEVDVRRMISFGKEKKIVQELIIKNY